MIDRPKRKMWREVEVLAVYDTKIPIWIWFLNLGYSYRRKTAMRQLLLRVDDICSAKSAQQIAGGGGGGGEE
jgi:hypothetical protein